MGDFLDKTGLKKVKAKIDAALATKLNASLKGVANGVAELDANGHVPSSQLPSYVDDVLEYLGIENFPTTGEIDKIYVDTVTNKTYRWSGSRYVQVSDSLALGETSGSAYRGDRGKTAYDHAMASGAEYSTGFYRIRTNEEGHVVYATAVVKSDITALGIPSTNTTYTFDGTYDASTNKAATVKTVTDAIDVLETEVSENKSKYCVCTTAADVAGKIVSITDSIFELNTGVIVNVLFQNANTADSPTLNVNSTGAKNIFHRGYQITSGTNKNELKDVVQFIYDGTNWRIIGNLVNTSNTAGASATSGVKMYPVAAFGQYGAAQTFTNSNVYIGADNELYSNNKKVATQTDITTLSNKIGSVGNTDLQTQVTSLNSKFHRQYIEITLNASGYYKWSYKDTEVTILSAFTSDHIIRYFTSTGDFWYFESSLWNSPEVLEVNKTIGLYVMYMDL